jgi:hypothetical protein
MSVDDQAPADQTRWETPTGAPAPFTATWLDRLATRLPAPARQQGQSCVLPMLTVGPSGEQHAHTIEMDEAGAVMAWRPGWPDTTGAVLRCDEEAGLALILGDVDRRNDRFVVVTPGGEPLPVDVSPLGGLTGIRVSTPVTGGGVSWLFEELVSPFGAGPVGYVAVGGCRLEHDSPHAPPPADDERVRLSAPYHQAVDFRVGSRDPVQMLENGGRASGPDDAVLRVFDYLFRLAATPAFQLPEEWAAVLYGAAFFGMTEAHAQMRVLLETEELIRMQRS